MIYKSEMEKIMIPILKYTWQNSDNPINSNESMLISAPFHLSTLCLKRNNIGRFIGAERNNPPSVGSVGLRKMRSRLAKSFCFRGLDLIVLKVRYDPSPLPLGLPRHLVYDLFQFICQIVVGSSMPCMTPDGLDVPCHLISFHALDGR